jgi:predicted nucleotidyltransferase
MKTADPKAERAVRAFLERISQRYSVIGARLFGSRSRADDNPGSDADLAVFLRGSRGNAIDVGVDMAGVAFDVLMDTEILVSPLPIWEEEWASGSLLEPAAPREHPTRWNRSLKAVQFWRKAAKSMAAADCYLTAATLTKPAAAPTTFLKSMATM